MSGKQNNRLDFKAQGQHIVFSSTYPDRNNNQWRLDVVGDERTVTSFIEARALDTWIEPLSEEQAKAHIQQAKAAQKRRTPQKSDRLPVNQPSELADLVVHLTLLSPLAPGAYRTVGELDPALREDAGGAAPQTFTVELPAGESAASVDYHASRGRIMVRLSGSGGVDTDGPDTDGTASVSLAAGNQQRSTWEIAVFRASEGIAEYDLRWEVTTILSGAI
jgi:hypothetical protein